MDRSTRKSALKYDGLTLDKRHRILRECYRNYLSFEAYVSDTGKDVIEYAIPREKDSEEWVPISICFTDLQEALKKFQDGTIAENTVLSKRKEQAFLLNVIQDKRQEDVAQAMGITTVSVGQYVEQSVIQLSKYYFAEFEQTEIEVSE